MTVYLWDKNIKEIKHYEDVNVVVGDKEGNLSITFNSNNKTKVIDHNKYHLYSVA